MVDISKFRHALKTFTKYEALYAELDSTGEQNTSESVEMYLAITTLSNKIKTFRTECEDAIECLELEIKEMINLVG